MDNKTQVAGDLAQHLAGHLFPLADGLEAFDILRADQKAVALLVFGHIDFQHRHGGIAHPDVADLDPAARMFDQLLEHIGRTAGALVVDDIDQALVAHLVAGPDDPVHLLLHLGVAALDRVEIELGVIFALHHAARPRRRRSRPGRPGRRPGR